MREIPLTRGQVAIVDDEHYEYLSQWKWWAQLDGGHHYAASKIYWFINGEFRFRNVKMHRIIAGISGYDVDHINGDTLDNRSENLRVATRAENIRNSHINKSTISGFKGVEKKRNRFKAYITKDQVKFHLGTFDTAEQAALAYNQAAVEMFGEWARLNNINDSKDVSVEVK